MASIEGRRIKLEGMINELKSMSYNMDSVRYWVNNTDASIRTLLKSADDMLRALDDEEGKGRDGEPGK